MEDSNTLSTHMIKLILWDNEFSNSRMHILILKCILYTMIEYMLSH